MKIQYLSTTLVKAIGMAFSSDMQYRLPSLTIPCGWSTLLGVGAPQRDRDIRLFVRMLWNLLIRPVQTFKYSKLCELTAAKLAPAKRIRFETHDGPH